MRSIKKKTFNNRRHIKKTVKNKKLRKNSKKKINRNLRKNINKNTNRNSRKGKQIGGMNDNNDIHEVPIFGYETETKKLQNLVKPINNDVKYLGTFKKIAQRIGNNRTRDFFILFDKNKVFIEYTTPNKILPEKKNFNLHGRFVLSLNSNIIFRNGTGYTSTERYELIFQNINEEKNSSSKFFRKKFIGDFYEELALKNGKSENNVDRKLIYIDKDLAIVNNLIINFNKWKKKRIIEIMFEVCNKNKVPIHQEKILIDEYNIYLTLENRNRILIYKIRILCEVIKYINSIKSGIDAVTKKIILEPIEVNYLHPDLKDAIDNFNEAYETLKETDELYEFTINKLNPKLINLISLIKIMFKVCCENIQFPEKQKEILAKEYRITGLNDNTNANKILLYKVRALSVIIKDEFQKRESPRLKFKIINNDNGTKNIELEPIDEDLEIDDEQNLELKYAIEGFNKQYKNLNETDDIYKFAHDKLKDAAEKIYNNNLV